MTTELADLFNQLKSDAKELKQALYLLRNRIAPEYISLEFNFSNKSLLNSVKELSEDLSVDYDAKEKYAKLGDSGELAADFIKAVSSSAVVEKQQEQLLPDKRRKYAEREYSVKEIYRELRQLAEAEGKGSVTAKSEILHRLLMSVSENEARYIARIVTGKMRLGVSSKTILDALSWAKVGDKSLRKQLDKAFGYRADIGEIAVLLLVEEEDLDNVELTLGIPVASQLVERESDAKAIIDRMEEVIAQPKYDGLRAQLHYSRKGFQTKDSDLIEEQGNVAIFSRNMTSLTEMFPDLVAILNKQKFDSVILDGEIIGYDETTDSFMPFQETIQRKRKYSVQEISEAIPVKYFVFDILLFNGVDQTSTPLDQRLSLLQGIDFVNEENMLELTNSPFIADADELEQHFRQQLDMGLEGVIAKNPASPYSPGKRGFDWIKLKANTFADLKDSVDTVIMGYYYGRGNRAQFGIGGFLVGIYNPELDVYQSLAKVGSGVKEEEWSEIKQRLDSISVKDLPHNYQVRSHLIPDVIVSPAIVMEVDADEISLSKNHMAGLTEADIKGKDTAEQPQAYSLRFPRLKDFDRDKSPEQTTSVSEIKRLYELGNKS
jgi:DNA ligase-1